jgi:hypothetical protein
MRGEEKTLVAVNEVNEWRPINRHAGSFAQYVAMRDDFMICTINKDSNFSLIGIVACVSHGSRIKDEYREYWVFSGNGETPESPRLTPSVDGVWSI